jgi:capsule assembly protein Wzi
MRHSLSLPPFLPRSAVLAALLLASSAAPGIAQRVPVGDHLEEYLRVLQVAGLAEGGSLTVRPVRVDSVLNGPAGGPWVDHLARPRRVGGWGAVSPSGLGLRVFENSAFPDGGNDGPAWQGRGLTVTLDAGVDLALGPVEATLHPVMAWSQNADFPLAEVRGDDFAPHAYPWGLMDLPQRPGDRRVAKLYPGNSSVRVRLGGMETGFGTENLWWGPGSQNALLMSNNAGGFPHAFLGTRRPLDIGFAMIEGQWIFGRLGLSDWFDPDYEDPGRYLTGAVVAISPKAVKGLTVGFERVFYANVPESGIGFGEYFLMVQGIEKEDFATPDNPNGEDERDQMFAAFGRWVLPESGFEAWVEWARNDHGVNLRDYFLEPGHAQAYTLGFRKVSRRAGGSLLTVVVEHTNLTRPITQLWRATPTFYRHGRVPPGYTHDGQVVGAALGPGGSGQYVATDLYSSRGRLGVFLARRVRDDDAYATLIAGPEVFPPAHDTSLDLGARGLWWVGDLEMGVQAALTRDLNRNFEQGRDRWNIHLESSLRWRPSE